MTAPRNPDRLIRTYLVEDQATGTPEVPDHVYSAIRDGIEHTRQRAVLGSIGVPDMNNILRIGLAAAAVVIIAIIAINLLPGTPTPGGSPSVSPSAEPSASPSQAGEAPGPVVVWNDASGVGNISFSMPASGWDVFATDGYATVSGQDDTGFLVFPGDLWIYGDPCAWSTTTPDTPATTVDEIIAALASQASRDASEPSDIMVAGYSGRSITLHVPADPEWDANCDEGTFGTLAADDDGDGEPASDPQRSQQGPGQIDEFWVLDVDGRPVMLDLTYWPDTPQEVIDEIYAVVESVTFGE
jgi:hypothetical protein